MPASTGTLINTPSNTLVKVRYRETYVSEGLNKKLNGIVPMGVVRGGNITTSLLALRVTIQADQSTGDSVYSYIDANGHQLTHRQVGDLVFDLTPFASTTIYLALYIDYTISGNTVAQWRAYTAAQLAAETETILVLGEVVVPAAGLIPVGNIASLYRQTAWETKSQGMTEWYQWVNNGSFESCKAIAAAPGSTDQPWPGWDTDIGTGLALNNVTAEVSTANPRSGLRHFRINLTGAAAQIGIMGYSGIEPVREGQRMRFSVWVRGTAAPGPGVGGHCGIQVAILNSTFNIVGTIRIDDLVAPTTGNYTEISEVCDVPYGVGAAFVTFTVLYDDDNANSTGVVDFDDVRAWLERDQVRDDGTPEQELYNASLRTKNLDIVEEGVFGSGVALNTIIDRMIQLRSLGVGGGVHDLVMQARDGGVTPFDLLLKNGGLNIERCIWDLGSQFLSTQNEMSTPRVLIPQGLDATYRLTLLAEIPNPDGSGPMRIYLSSLRLPNQVIEQGNLNQGGIMITNNAYWIDSPTFKWFRDVAGEDSTAISLTQGGLGYHYRNYQETSGWVWNVGSIGTPSGPSPGVAIMGDEGLAGFPGGDYVDLRLGRATITFSNPGSGDDEWFSTSNATHVRNRLSARNIFNAWANIHPDGALGFGASTQTYGCSLSYLGAGPPYDIRVTYNFTFGGALASQLVLANYKSGSTGANARFVVPYNASTARVDLRIYDDTGAIVDCDNSLLALCVAVIGIYTSSP